MRLFAKKSGQKQGIKPEKTGKISPVKAYPSKKKAVKTVIRDNLSCLWAGLCAGALVCLAATKRRGFAVIAAGAAVCGAAALAGASPGAQELLFCIYAASSALFGALLSLAAKVQSFLRKTKNDRKTEEDKNKFTNKSVRRP